MATTRGDSTYGYFSIPNGTTPKPVNVLSEVVSSPRIDAGKIEKERYIEFLNGYIT